MIAVFTSYDFKTMPMLFRDWLNQVRGVIPPLNSRRAVVTSRRRSRLQRVRQAAIESLERRVLLSGTVVDGGAGGDAIERHAAWYVPSDFEGELPDFSFDRDHGPSSSHGGTAPHNPNDFVLLGTQWPQPDGLGSPITVTYSYSNLLDGSLPGGMTQTQLRSAIEEALGVWAEQAPLHFVEVIDSGPPPADQVYAASTHADLRIGHHFIDGGTGANVLAHAFAPGADGINGDLHFDNSNTWTLDPSTGINFLEVAVHELGHALGIDHEPSPPDGQEAIMNPVYAENYEPGLGNAFLFQDDIDAIRAIYGEGVGSVTPLGGGGGGGQTDDHGNNAFQSTHVGVPSTTIGVIEYEGDTDWFSFDAVEGVLYTFETELFALQDSTLTLYERNGTTVLEFNDDVDGSSRSSHIEWMAPLAGTYYLKVESADGVGLGSYSLSVEEAASAAKPTLISPESPTDDLTPTFIWTPSVNSARYEIWVVDLTDGGTVVHNTDVQGTRFTPEQPLTGGHEYRARVRGISANGVNKTEFSDPYEFTINLVSLETPVLAAVQFSGPTAIPTFQWSEIEGADRYDLWVNDLTTGESGVIREPNVTRNFFTPDEPLTRGHRYIWTVRAIHENGVGSAWAKHQRFFVPANLEVAPLITPSSATALDTLEFAWEAVDGAARYHLWVNNMTTGQIGVIYEPNLTDTSYTDTSQLQFGHRYIWTVRPIDADGVGGEWSPHQIFTVIPQLGTPGIVSPNRRTTDTSPTFEWTEVPGAASYDLWVNDLTTGQIAVIRTDGRPDNDPSSIPDFEPLVTGTSYTHHRDLKAGHSYIWTIRALDADGNSGLWADHRTFTIDVDLGVPKLLGPTGTASNETPVFSWSAVPNAAFYDLWVNDLTTGQSGVIRNTRVEGTSYTGEALVPGHRYIWTVRAIHESGVGGAQAPHERFTLTIPLQSPDISPGPSGTIGTTAPTFTWNAVDGAARYELFVTDAMNNAAVISQKNLTTTTFNPTNPLLAGHRYRWWVRAFDAAGNAGRWSSAGTFEIGAATLVTTNVEPHLAPSNSLEASDEVFSDLRNEDGLAAVLYGNLMA